MIKEVVALSALTIASFTDIKTREVPDWLSYGLIAIGFGFNILYSIIFSEMNSMISAAIGFLVLFGVGCLMFYTGQWGGGDSKIMMGLGALFGINILGLSIRNMPFLAVFWINLLMVSVVYASLWSIALAMKHRKEFSKTFNELLERFMWLRVIILTLGIAILIVFFILPWSTIKIFLIIITILLITLFYLSILMKAVEKSCMLKMVEPEKLTEGDWIFKDIKVEGKYICGPKDLGISKKQIKELISLKKKKKINKIMIKEGIPFVPSFLIAYLISLVFGAWFMIFL